MLTEEQIHKSDHISEEEILQDIKITEIEIKDFQDENDVLMRNPPQNRTRIYLNEGHISQRKEFVNKLNQILDYRKKNK
ncbi:MAG TPA: hypothetical protein DC057_14415 [Spirochaetia bacterium]|nr:hypothetical protein [Spirochaetia bacterium]